MAQISDLLIPYRRIMVMFIASLFSMIVGILLGLFYQPVWLELSVFSTYLTIFAFSASFLYFGRGGLLAGFVLGLFFGKTGISILVVGSMVTTLLAILAGIWFAHMAYKDMLGRTSTGSEIGFGLASLFLALFTAIGIDLIYL